MHSMNEVHVCFPGSTENDKLAHVGQDRHNQTLTAGSLPNKQKRVRAEIADAICAGSNHLLFAKRSEIKTY